MHLLTSVHLLPPDWLAMTERLFVYGTLAPGRPNAHILAPLGGSWIPATVCGHLKSQGWGDAMGYPGLVPDASGDVVSGFLFTSDKLPAALPMLDAFEGAEYLRERVQASLEDGSVVDAWAYVLNAR